MECCLAVEVKARLDALRDAAAKTLKSRSSPELESWSRNSQTLFCQDSCGDSGRRSRGINPPIQTRAANASQLRHFTTQSMT